MADLNVGDKAADFKLKNVDGKYVSLSDMKDVKGVIVIFTCNHCPFAKKYEDRIIALDKQFKKEGYPVVAINPNDPKIESEDSYENLCRPGLKRKALRSHMYLTKLRQPRYRLMACCLTHPTFTCCKSRLMANSRLPTLAPLIMILKTN